MVQFMDPNLIHLDWERTFEALMMIVVLAFIIERALAVLFESKIFILYADRAGIKEVIALAVAIAVCVVWKFDAVSMIVLTAQTTPIGYAITGAVIAGGSKASLKLFRDLMQIRSTSYENRYEIQANKAVQDAQAGRDKAVKAGSVVAATAAADDATRAALRAQQLADTSGSGVTHLLAQRAMDAAHGARHVVEERQASPPPTS